MAKLRKGNAAFLTALLIVCPVVQALAADFQTGLEAYERGDLAAALREWRPLAEQGDAEAQYMLGLMYNDGMGVPKDDAEAANWYRKAAEQGDAGAQYNLGMMYAHGEGVSKDPVEATLWLRKAAEQRHLMAQSNLRRLQTELEAYERGNLSAALLRELRPLAEHGDAEAQFNLGVMYANGESVPKDIVEATVWYRKAAERGHAWAQYRLGLGYTNGRGIPKDDVEGYAWLSIAAAQDSEVEAHERDVLARKMAPAQLAEAQRLAHEYWEKYVLPFRQ